MWDSEVTSDAAAKWISRGRDEKMERWKLTERRINKLNRGRKAGLE